MPTANTNPVRDHAGGDDEIVEPVAVLADDIENKPTGEAEPQGDVVSYVADDIDNEPTGDGSDPTPETVTTWPHEAIVKQVQGEDKQVKETRPKATTKKDADHAS
jgi:hypothetical protein